MSINCIIIDDEVNNIENLASLINSHCPELIVIGKNTSPVKAKSLIAELKPDLIFLDIQMPEQSGFDMLRDIGNLDFEVIFVTAYDQYGIQAIKFSALDYLLKPINVEELKLAVSKAIAKVHEKKENKQLTNLLSFINEKQNKAFHRIALQSSKETRFIEPSKIIRCESSNNYTTFFLVNNEQILTSKPIYEYEEIMQEYGFVRCHQSHLVNKNFIKSIVKEDGGYLLMEDNSRVPLSRQKRDAIRAALE